MVAPKHPHAWINVDNRYHPAIIIEWKRIILTGMRNMPTWQARCLYWANGEPAVTLVPEARVKPA